MSDEKIPQWDPLPNAPNVTLRRRSKGGIAAVFVALLVLAALIYHFLRAGGSASPVGAETLTVAVIDVRREPISREVIFDSELRPYQEVDLHAKVAGYVQSINVDIGDHVREGQLIATLELPEVASDLDHAKAAERRSASEVKRAEAAQHEARVTLDRMNAVEVVSPNLIARQDIDTADSRSKGADAALASAHEQSGESAAEVKKLETMLQYTKIVAPFDGVITERFADKGALIQAGTSSSTQAMPLVRLSDNHRLRLVFPVSVSFVTYVHPGEPVELELPAANKKIKATVTRTSQKVSTSTRTMDGEVDIANDDYSLIPGMYAAVHLQVDTKTNALVLPIEAMSRSKNPTVFVVNRDNIIEERPVKVGLETSSKVEALSGLSEGDQVMIGNRSGVKPGQKVIVKRLNQTTAINPETL